MNIRIHVWENKKYINIDGVDFAYSNMRKMYGDKDGVGLQSDLINDDTLLKMCNEIADSIYKYLGEK